MTASHFFAFSAGISPGNAVFNGFAVAPNVCASAAAMSTSNPPTAPLEEASSIGGNEGSVQNVNVVACLAPPAVPAMTTAAAAAIAAAIVALMLLSFWPGGRTLTGNRVEREQVERDVRRRERRRLAGAVVGRSDLDDVAAHEP